jgi:hypothetical protein
MQSNLSTPSLESDPSNQHKWFTYFDQLHPDKQYANYVEHLRELQNFAAKYSAQRIYRDFVKIYEGTVLNINPEILKLIARISESYGEDAADLNYLFTIIYFAMLSEQHRKDARLGKRIKRLAVYQALFDQYPAEEINYYPSRKWWLLEAQCSQRGF